MVTSQNRMRFVNSGNIILGGSYRVSREFIDRMCGEAALVDHTTLVARVTKIRKNGVNIELDRDVETFIGMRNDFNVGKFQFDEYFTLIKEEVKA